MSAAKAVRVPALSGIVSVPPHERVTDASLEQADRLGCDVYDACAPAVATLLDAPLYSANRRAHAACPGAVLIG
ncbi:MAG: hypothetical protein ABFC80_00230 [Coriobacteriales bacterium]|nr:hypothetical protein [Actinomycetes bacterium]